MKKKRYAICGLSVRGMYHFMNPIRGLGHADGPNFSDTSEIVGILDIDMPRVEQYLSITNGDIPHYLPDDFGKMIAETRPDVVLVASPDYSHARYIVAGLDAGCDVIVEKPMAINCAQVREIQAAEARSGRALRVAFNYRYPPAHKQLKRFLMEGNIGRVTNVEFTYNLDTNHGSSYFYRWNRERDKSGGLCIHKCCHHFDLVNWFVGDTPVELFSFVKLNYYGADGALRPRDEQGRPYEDHREERRHCPVFEKHYSKKIRVDKPVPNTGWDKYKLPLEAQYPSSKPRWIYDKAIDIEDTISMTARYKGGASLSYSCNFCTPWEGFVLGINGTKGRVEMSNHSNPDPTGVTDPAQTDSGFTFFPLFGGKEVITVPAVAGGHGGADYAIQRDLFGEVCEESKELKLVAGAAAGAVSVAMGEAVWRSSKDKRVINLDDLLSGKYDA